MKIYYWPNKDWCYEDQLEEWLQDRSDDFATMEIPDDALGRIIDWAVDAHLRCEGQFEHYKTYVEELAPETEPWVHTQLASDMARLAALNDLCGGKEG